MKRMKMEKVGTFVLIGLLLLGAVGIASAQQPLPTGGDSFDDAVTIEPGSYETDHEMGWRDDDMEYFKITELNAGQTLKISITTDWVTDETAWAGIYDSSRVGLHDDSFSASETNAVASWATSSTDTFYIKIGSYVSTLQVGASIDISVENHYDANSTTDAGDTYATALDVTAGNYESCHMAGDKYGSEPGDDDKDYYVISLESGQLLDVTVTPPSDASFGLTIYDQDRTNVASTNSANPGAITSTSWTAPSAQDVYVAITNIGDDGGTYSLSLSFEAAPGKATLTVQTTPVNASVYVDDTLWGTAPQTKSVDPGTYTVSFGSVSGYTTPSSQSVTLVAEDSETVTGIYTEIETDGNGDGGGTPGFETLAVIAAIGVALIILRRRK